MSSARSFKPLFNKILNRPEWAAAAGVIGALAALVLASLLAWPAADDFCYGARALTMGAWGSTVQEYFNWGGRYSATFLMTAFGGNPWLMLHGYALVGLGIFLSLMVAGMMLLRRLHVLSGAIALQVVAILLLALSWRETVYWLAGGFTYGLGLAAWLAVASAYFVARPGVGLWGVGAVATFLLAGFNETLAVTNIGLLGLIGLWRWHEGRWRAFPWAVFGWGVIAVVGLATVYFAPGNAVRASQVVLEGSLPPSPLFALNALWMPLIHLETLLGMLVMLGALWVIWQPKVLPVGPRTLPTWAIGVAVYLLVVLAMATRAYALHGVGPHRAYSVEIAVIWLGCVVVSARAYQAWLAPQLKGAATGWRWAAVLVLAVTLLGFRGADWRPLRDDLVALARGGWGSSRMMAARYRTILDSRGQPLELPLLPPVYADAPVVMIDLDASPADWKNACVAWYFGTGAITGVKP